MSNDLLKPDKPGGENAWVKAEPQQLPKPTYWPFFFAMGLAFSCWGILLGWIVAGSGLLLVLISLIGWINELRDEARTDRR